MDHEGLPLFSLSIWYSFLPRHSPLSPGAAADAIARPRHHCNATQHNITRRNNTLQQPVGLSRGRGIFVVNDIAAVQYGEAFVVQASALFFSRPAVACASGPFCRPRIHLLARQPLLAPLCPLLRSPALRGGPAAAGGPQVRPAALRARDILHAAGGLPLHRGATLFLHT